MPDIEKAAAAISETFEQSKMVLAAFIRPMLHQLSSEEVMAMRDFFTDTCNDVLGAKKDAPHT